MTTYKPLTPSDHHRIGQRLQKIARMIERELEKATGGKFVGFSLITWGGTGNDPALSGNPNGERRSQYVANISRETAAEALAETLERWRKPGYGELGIPERPLGGAIDAAKVVGYIPCGGCGATHPKERCIGCLHQFSRAQ